MRVACEVAAGEAGLAFAAPVLGPLAFAGAKGFQARAFAKDIHHETVPGGHYLQLDAPDTLNSPLRRFLEKRR